jgi:hypothetical protein
MIRNLWWSYKRRRAIRQIRESFLFFGYVLDVTDQELEDAAVGLAREMRDMDLSMDEAARAIVALNKALGLPPQQLTKV